MAVCFNVQVRHYPLNFCFVISFHSYLKKTHGLNYRFHQDFSAALFQDNPDDRASVLAVLRGKDIEHPVLYCKDHPQYYRRRVRRLIPRPAVLKKRVSAVSFELYLH